MLLRYPGGKKKLKKVIMPSIREASLGGGVQYREPFFGGGGLELLFEPANFRRIWVNDLDAGIAALWTAVIRYPGDLKKRILEFTPSVDAFDAFKKQLLSAKSVPDDRDALVDLGFKKLAIHRISWSGLGTMAGGPLGGRPQKNSEKIDARWSPEHLCRNIETIHARFAAFDVHSGACTCLDFAALIEDRSCPALLYLDPPYAVKGNTLYQCGFTEMDHVRLAGLLKKTPHSWVLSYDDCPLVRDLYSWAVLCPLDVGYSISSPRRTTELLITPRAPEAILPVAIRPRRTIASTALAS